MSTIVELINERAAQIMEQAGTSEKVINVKNISKSDAIEMAIEQLVKEGLIKAPTMTAAERREKLAKARFKTGVFTQKPKPTPEPEPTPEPKEEARRTTTKPQAKTRKVATELTTADLYKFTGDDGLRPLFNGVHYADGHAEATDAHILIRVPFSYPADYEGKTISKLGNEIEGKYPNTASVIPDIAEGNKDGYKAYPFDAEKVLQQCKDLITLTKSLGIGENDCRLQTHGVFFSPIYMKQIAEICLKYGGSEIYICPDRYKCCLVPILGGVIILMPTGDAKELYINSETNQIVKGPNYSFGTSLHSYLEDNLNTAKQAAEMYQKADAEKEYKKALSDVKRRESGLEVLGRYQPIRTAPKTRTGATAVARPEKSRLQNLKLFRVPKATEEEQKRFQRRERLAAIRAKRGATAARKVVKRVFFEGVNSARERLKKEGKETSIYELGLRRAGKKKVSDADIDFLPANLRGKELPTGGDYDDFAQKAMNETIGDPAVFIWQYTKGPYWYSFSSDYPEQNKDLTEILRLTEAHKKGHDIDSEGRIITNVIDINGNRVREGDWVRVSGSWSEAENRMYRVQKLEGGWIDSQLMQFGMVPINQDGTDAKSAAFNIWPFWNSGHSKSEDREAYHKHNKENLKIEILPKQPKEIKVTERYRATKDGIYLPDKTYVPVYYHNGTKDGEPIEVSAREYDGNLLFLQTDTDIVVNNSDGMTDYFEKDRITVTKDNPLYDIVRLGALKNLLANLGIAKKSTVGIYERSVRRAEEAFNATRSPQASITLLEEQKRLKAAQKEYEEEMNKGEDIKREIARLERKIKGEKTKTKTTESKQDKREDSKYSPGMNVYFYQTAVWGGKDKKEGYIKDIDYDEDINQYFYTIVEKKTGNPMSVLERNIIEEIEINPKTLKRRERLASIRAKQGATKATKPKGTPRKPKAATEPDEKTISRRERLAAIRAKYGITPVQPSPKGKKLRFPKSKAEPVAETTPTDETMSIEEAVKFAISMAPTINENAARRAKEMRSYDDYKEGSETASFEAQVREAAKFSKKWPKERSGEFFRLLNLYARRLAEYMNRDNEIGTRVPSVLIAGPSNFPVRKKQKQVAAWDKNQEFYNEKVAPVLSKLEYPSRQGIKSSDSDALQKLKDKLERMERNQELMKRANADFTKAVKEKKTVGEFLQQVSYLSDEMKKEAMYGIKSWHGKPFPPFQLQNANQEMRRLKQRIADISKVKEEGSGEVEKYKNDHFTVERDTDIMRYKLIFDGVPAKEVRDVIKKNGAHWSPHYVAWLLPLTGTSGYKIESIIQELDKMNN